MTKYKARLIKDLKKEIAWCEDTMAGIGQRMIEAVKMLEIIEKWPVEKSLYIAYINGMVKRVEDLMAIVESKK